MGKSLVKRPRFIETRGATARAQAKEICESFIKSLCRWCYLYKYYWNEMQNGK